MRLLRKNQNKSAKAQRYAAAISDLNQFKFININTCANFHKVPYTTLHTLMIGNKSYQGGGRKSLVFTIEEEKEIFKHVKWRAEVSCGLTWMQLQSLVQEPLLALKISNQDRITGFEKDSQCVTI